MLDALAPLVDAAGDPDALTFLLSELGWTPASIPKPLSDLAAAGSKLVALLEADPDSVTLPQALDAIAALVTAIDTIRAQPDAAFPTGIDIAAFKSTIGRDLFDYLLVEHLLTRRHDIGGVLRLAGVLRLVDTPAAGLRQRYLRREVAWNEIGDLVADPPKGFRDAYAWQSSAPALTTSLGVLGSVLEAYGFRFAYLRTSASLLPFVNSGATGPEPAVMGIDVSLVDPSEASTAISAGLRLVVRAATAQRGAAIALLPYADLKGAQDIAIGDRLHLSIAGDVDFTKGVAITLAPGHAPVLEAGFLGGAATNPGEARIGLKIAAAADDPDVVLIGTADGSRFAMRGATVSAGARVIAADRLDAFVQVDLDDARIVIRPDPGEGDSFLGSLIGDGIDTTFSVGVRLSSASGFHFTGSGTLQTSVPVAIQLGPIALQAIAIGLAPSAQGVAVTFGATARGTLGPATAVVDGIGFSLTMRFPDPPTGNLGPVDVGFGFKPPSGIGLSIDAGGVVGGGFLFHDPVQSLYAGVMQLSFSGTLTLSAFGLIATRLPDGSRGYSLIVFITAQDFKPIPLGMGFMLLGIGGMVAINRTFDVDVLRAGLKNDTLGTLLFPRDPVGNAPALIRSLATAFPARPGSYLLGLLVKIGWFTPTLVTLDLALILEFGSRKRLLVLGRISSLLPSPDNDLIRLKLDAIGVLDFDAGTTSIDAVLVDSQLAHAYALTGAMALRARWSAGPGSSFVLAVGGLHPQFPPPADLPRLERVAIALASGNNPRLTCSSYFAITANTVQFGARAQAYAAAYGFSVEGDIGFDVLLQIAPLHFIADFHAKVQLKRGSSNLFSVSLDGELEGPRPLRVSGKASFSIFWCDFSVRFDTTLVDGEKPPPPPAIDLSAELRKALALPTSWTMQASSAHGVALRQLPASAALVLDPLGMLVVKQQVVPLNTGRDIDLYGGAPVSGARRFALAATLQGNPQGTSPVRASFAPSQFFAMSDDDKLAAPSFEVMDAGIAIGSGEVAFDEIVPAPLTYQAIVVDTMPQPSTQTDRYHLPPTRLLFHARSGAAARAPARRVGLARFTTADAPAAATLNPERWTIRSFDEATAATVDPNVKTWSDYRASLARLNRAAANWQMVPTHELVN